jgi:hypothetical protein
MGGALHLLLSSATGVEEPRIWYRRVPPGLLVTATPAKLAAGRVTVKVTDAGTALRGARVRFLGTAKLTNRNGVAVFRVAAAVKAGSYLVTGAKAGYAKGSDRVRVT